MKYFILLAFIVIACAVVVHADDDDYNKRFPIRVCKKRCPPNYRCVFGRCLCIRPFSLRYGRCVRPPFCPKCPPNFSCLFGRCVCRPPRELVHGRCIIKPSCPIRCPPFSRCINGDCVCNFPRVKRYGQCVLNGCGSCHKNATCEYNRCRCRPGFVGDGKRRCRPRCRPRCRFGNVCRVVHNYPQCVCRRGYRKHGTACRRY